jgi:selenocysteine-specific elongation factor
MTMHVVATAGHVDHGKSSLVLALTGTDPDRFEEEKRRGLTIDLGFAHVALPSGAGISFIDVPGHVKFLKNMLAGIGAVDACLFVVAATEGWKPQSEEHLRILELVGVQRGVIALTKTDLVDDDELELARLLLADQVLGTFLEDAPVIATAATLGRGLDELRIALDDLVANTPTAMDRGRARLWVDRVFAAKGSGTVVTGTLAGGEVAVGDQVVVGPRQLPARIRAIQSLGSSHQQIGPGNRVALNLNGVEHQDIVRGDAVVPPGRWHRTTTFDARLQVLGAVDHEVSRRGAYVAYIGSGEFSVRMRVLGTEGIEPAGEGFVRLRTSTPLPLLPGDRFVLRESGRSETVGGGEILDVAPVVNANRARPDRNVDRVVAERGWVDVDELELLTGERRAATIGRWVGAPGKLDAMLADVRARVDAADSLGLDVASLDEREREALAQADGLELVAGRVRVAAVVDPLADHPFVGALASSLFAPPAADGVDRAALRALIQRGLVLEHDGVWFHPDVVGAATQVAKDLLAENPDGFTIAQFRDKVGATRKHALPLVALLDQRGITRRREDFRIPGPRLNS